MYLIIGLGNPEKDYRGTRHNVGFEVVSKLAYDHRIDINKAKFRAHLGEGFICGQKVILLKPQTYMNLSGESVRDALRFYKLAPIDMLVIYDDTDLEVGQIRVRESGSAGGHNGMKNIIYQLETDKFARVRVGIGQKPPGWDLADYVLSKFRREETDLILEGITRAGEAVETILSASVADAMNRYNKITKNKGKVTEPSVNHENLSDS